MRVETLARLSLHLGLWLLAAAILWWWFTPDDEPDDDGSSIEAWVWHLLAAKVALVTAVLAAGAALVAP